MIKYENVSFIHEKNKAIPVTEFLLFKDQKQTWLVGTEKFLKNVSTQSTVIKYLSRGFNAGKRSDKYFRSCLVTVFSSSHRCVTRNKISFRVWEASSFMK